MPVLAVPLGAEITTISDRQLAAGKESQTQSLRPDHPAIRDSRCVKRPFIGTAFQSRPRRRRAEFLELSRGTNVVERPRRRRGMLAITDSARLTKRAHLLGHP